MNKLLLICSVLAETSMACAFQKMDAKYLICYGNAKADCEIVEYFSLSCPKCFDFFKEDFPSIRKKYIESGKVFWIFHPDPVDLSTLQMMVCLEHLPDGQKPLFFDALVKHLIGQKNRHSCLIMQAAMEALECPLPDLDKIEFLEKSSAFKESVKFLMQKDVIDTIPTVEVNGAICKQYPTIEMLEKQIEQKTKRFL